MADRNMKITYGGFSLSLKGFEEPVDILREVMSVCEDTLNRHPSFGEVDSVPGAGLLEKILSEKIDDTTVALSPKNEETSPVSDEGAMGNATNEADEHSALDDQADINPNYAATPADSSDEMGEEETITLRNATIEPSKDDAPAAPKSDLLLSDPVSAIDPNLPLPTSAELTQVEDAEQQAQLDDFFTRPGNIDANDPRPEPEPAIDPIIAPSIAEPETILADAEPLTLDTPQKVEVDAKPEPATEKSSGGLLSRLRMRRSKPVEDEPVDDITAPMELDITADASSSELKDDSLSLKPAMKLEEPAAEPKDDDPLAKLQALRLEAESYEEPEHEPDMSLPESGARESADNNQPRLRVVESGPSDEELEAELAQLGAEEDADPLEGKSLPEALQVPGLVTPDVFAKVFGCEGINDEIEAAAAYLTLIRGQLRFSRAELLHELDEVAIEKPHPAEHKIRAFSKMMRSGKLLRADADHFTMAPKARSLFEAAMSA